MSAVLQTPDAQTRVPFATVHVALIGAVAGRSSPLAVFVVHTPVAHHCVATAQSVSSVHTSAQAPAALHVAPVWPAPQSRFDTHVPHEPALPPARLQYGFAVVGQACVAALALSPLHAAHVFVPRTQVGVPPLQAVVLVAEHAAHVPFARHAGVPADWHGRVAPEPLSPLHDPHVFVATSHVGATPAQAVTFVVVHCTHWPLVHAGVVTGQGAAVAVPLSPVHATHAPATQAGKPPEQSAEVTQGKHAEAPPGGFGQLLPPLTTVPRQLHGLTVVRLPQASPATSVLQVPFTRPGTTP